LNEELFILIHTAWLLDYKMLYGVLEGKFMKYTHMIQKSHNLYKSLMMLPR